MKVSLDSRLINFDTNSELQFLSNEGVETATTFLEEIIVLLRKT